MSFSFLSALLSRSPPSHFFHYTSVEGLLGICASRAIWLTDVSFLNDEKEIRDFCDTIDNVICNMAEISGNSLALSDDNERSFLRNLKVFVQAPLPGIFVASFTENRDLLSQWRAYCRPNAGYSIGFPSTALRRAAQSAGFLVAPCVYDHKEKFRAAMEIVQKYLGKYRSGAAPLEPDESNAQEFRVDYTRMGALFKHRAFSEEQEWRVISPPLWFRADVRFRSGSTTVLPYVELPFGDELYNLPPSSDLSDKMVFIVGPTINSNLAGFGCQWATEVAFPGKCAYGSSEAPLRSS